MSTDSASTTQEDESPLDTKSVSCGQTGHLRALDRLLRPASPTSEIWDTETQYNGAGRRDEQAQGEIAESPTAEAHPVLAPSHLHDSSSCSDGKENRPPGLVFQVAVSDTCHRVEANGSIDSGQDEQIELKFGFPLRKPVQITLRMHGFDRLSKDGKLLGKGTRGSALRNFEGAGDRPWKSVEFEYLYQP
ncbi:hypothetical protein HRG_011307 [Hirsutella rhossiliensis]|uniref:Uncharacterized protein n=1 Tax=Hirsutella rhossiliensis TaxID=111463 RepID=A0A9P8MM05_9HYPO|nr:uncharacterized protein HRG_11307 [Hirsutella rhossiliensis]KAH0957525.1 hypothetical protein HRG_11307 [Hirsutella rhossiliensis]